MDKSDISKAISALKNGHLIVYPTDTLYGLGADIFNNNAVKKVFELKKRPLDDPLSVAVSNINQLEKIALLDEKSKKLIEKFLPGKLTIILKKKDIVSDLITAGLDRVAVRIPDNKIALELISNFGPITATSANIHGLKTPGIIKDINMQFKENIAVYLDDGKLEDQASTIVDMTGEKVKIVRQGTITKKEILDAI